MFDDPSLIFLRCGVEWDIPRYPGHPTENLIIRMPVQLARFALVAVNCADEIAGLCSSIVRQDVDATEARPHVIKASRV